MPLATSVSPVLSQQRAVAVMRYAFEAPRVLSQPLSYNVYRLSALAFHAREWRAGGIGEASPAAVRLRSERVGLADVLCSLGASPRRPRVLRAVEAARFVGCRTPRRVYRTRLG